MDVAIPSANSDDEKSSISSKSSRGSVVVEVMADEKHSVSSKGSRGSAGSSRLKLRGSGALGRLRCEAAVSNNVQEKNALGVTFEASKPPTPESIPIKVQAPASNRAQASASNTDLWSKVIHRFEERYKSIYINTEVKKKAHLDCCDDIGCSLIHEPKLKWCPVLLLDALVHRVYDKKFTLLELCSVERRQFNQHQELKRAIILTYGDPVTATATANAQPESNNMDCGSGPMIISPELEDEDLSARNPCPMLLHTISSSSTSLDCNSSKCVKVTPEMFDRDLEVSMKTECDDSTTNAHSSTTGTEDGDSAKRRRIGGDDNMDCDYDDDDDEDNGQLADDIFNLLLNYPFSPEELMLGDELVLLEKGLQEVRGMNTISGESNSPAPDQAKRGAPHTIPLKVHFPAFRGASAQSSWSSFEKLEELLLMNSGRNKSRNRYKSAIQYLLKMLAEVPRPAEEQAQGSAPPNLSFNEVLKSVVVKTYLSAMEPPVDKKPPQKPSGRSSTPAATAAAAAAAAESIAPPDALDVPDMNTEQKWDFATQSIDNLDPLLQPRVNAGQLHHLQHVVYGMDVDHANQSMALSAAWPPQHPAAGEGNYPNVDANQPHSGSSHNLVHALPIAHPHGLQQQHQHPQVHAHTHAIAHMPDEQMTILIPHVPIDPSDPFLNPTPGLFFAPLLIPGATPASAEDLQLYLGSSQAMQYFDWESPRSPGESEKTRK